MCREYLTSLVITGSIICCSCGSLFAQGLTWSGYLQTDDRLQLKGRNNYSWQEYRLNMQAEVKPDEKTRLYSEVWLRSWGVPGVQNSSDLSDKDKVAPWGLDIRETYVDFYGFIFSHLDLRIGRQRIAWGTGDKINPTDNLNPYDLEDLWDFGRHMGSDGIKMTWYQGGFTFTGTVIPTFTPAVLPRGEFASALFPPVQLPTGLSLGSMNNNITFPRNNLKESTTIGFKVAKKLFDYDLSLSYVHGRDGLPLVRKATFVPVLVPDTVDISNELVYPRMNILGLDMAGSLAKVGIWSEAALFFPERVKLTTDLSALGMGTVTSMALDNNPYIKYVLGADYTFKNNIYINGQYVHGIFYERGSGNLEDYLMGRVEWKNSDETIKLTPITVCAEVKDTKDIKNNYALVYWPEISYYPANSELTLGVRFIDGKSTTTFGRLNGKNEIYLEIKYSF
ncbi:MAG: hypothetical protein WCE90_12180 [Candidatus Zixiibacteriota bacterium]